MSFAGAPSWRRVLVTVVGSLFAAACGPASEVDPDPVVHLLVTGSCATDVRELDMRQSSNRLFVTYPEGAVAVPFPRQGALDQAGHPIREGGWQLWGCMRGTEPCFDEFRYCTARRQAWQLDVTCQDGTGALVCNAVLTE